MWPADDTYHAALKIENNKVIHSFWFRQPGYEKSVAALEEIIARGRHASH